MCQQPEVKQMLEIFSVDTADLEGLQATFDAQEAQLGPVAQIPRGSTLNFDVSLTSELLFKVLGVLASSALPKLIEWAIATIKKKKDGDPPIIIQVGKKKAELSAGTDPGVVRAVLDDLLKPNRA